VLAGVSRSHLDLAGGGPRIALLDWGGDGPPALLHHANGFCAALWAPVAERLRPHFRVFAMDARGHGDSSKPRSREAYHWSHFGRDVEAVAAWLAERFGRVGLGLGHSFGGTAIALAAIADPALFDCIVLVDPIVVPSDAEARGRISQGSQLAEGARKRREVWESREEARAKWQGKETFAGFVPQAFDLYLAEALADRPDGRVELKCPGEVEAAIFEQGGSVDVMALAPRLETPTLVLWAARGNFPRSHFEALVARMPHGRLRDVDAGHLVPMQAPERVADEVLAFSARSAGPARSRRRSPRAATPRG
jgi:pimeloyl-ACP methyl ester carboxylesterase